MTCKNNRWIVSNHCFRKSWYEFLTRWYEMLYQWCRLWAPLAPVKVGCGKGLHVEISTDNTVETIVFGNTDIPHPCNHSVPQQSVAGLSSVLYIYIYIYVCVCVCVCLDVLAPGFTYTSAEVTDFPASLGVTCSQHVEYPSCCLFMDRDCRYK